jgi:ribosomal protein S18 acetylase RimI-like enzyme
VRALAFDVGIAPARAMNLEFASLAHFGLDRAAEVIARGFDDYFVKLACSPAWLMHMARSDSVDLAASRVIVRDGTAVGAALIARRGWTSRVAGMTLVPEARRQGIGRATMTQLLADAKDRRERAMVLEVIEQNEAGVKLYQACGFRRVRRLVGFLSGSAQTSGDRQDAGGTIEEVDLRALAAVVAREGLNDLPWQLSSESLAQLTPPTVAYRLQGAWIAVANLATSEPLVRALVTEHAQQRQGRAAALLRALMARYPAKEWRTSAIWPEELAGVFVKAGFQRTALSQWQMVRELV